MRSQCSLVYALALCTIVILIILIIGIMMYKSQRIQAVEVPREVLYSVLQPGRYVGKGKYTPTGPFPNGLTVNLEMNITETPTGATFQINATGYDAVTGDEEYTGRRVGRFDYKPNQGQQVFRNTRSYIGDTLVSSGHGRIVSASKGYFKTISSGSWYMSAREHEIVTEAFHDGENFKVIHYNEGLIPFVPHNVMVEEYKMLK